MKFLPFLLQASSMRILVGPSRAQFDPGVYSLHLSMLKLNVGNVSETPMIRSFSLHSTILSEMDEIGKKAYYIFNLKVSIMV